MLDGNLGAFDMPRLLPPKTSLCQSCVWHEEPHAVGPEPAKCASTGQLHQMLQPWSWALRIERKLKPSTRPARPSCRLRNRHETRQALESAASPTAQRPLHPLERQVRALKLGLASASATHGTCSASGRFPPQAYSGPVVESAALTRPNLNVSLSTRAGRCMYVTCRDELTT